MKNIIDGTKIITTLCIIWISLSQANQFDHRYNVKAFGAKGDSITFDDSAIVRTFQTANLTGGTIFFPEGKYRIAKGRALVFDKAQNIRLVGENAALFFDTTTGVDGEVIAFRNGPKNITIDSLIFFDQSSNPNSYDNMLTFTAETGAIKNVVIRDCIFKSSSNKQIHFGDKADSINIQRCEFYNSCYNVAPLFGWNSFGAIFFLWNDSSTFSNITISNNNFKNNNVYCISLNQWDDKLQPMFSKVVIENNIFKSSSYGIITRGINGIRIENNSFDSVGLSYVNNKYLFDSTLSRYLSKKRKQANQRAVKAITANFESMPIIYVSNTKECSINNNKFSYCLSSQFPTTGNINTIGITVKSSSKVSIENNIFLDNNSIKDLLERKIILSDHNIQFYSNGNKLVFPLNHTETPIQINNVD